MTTTASSNLSENNTANTKQRKYSPVFHNWKCNVKSSKKMLIMLTILHLLAAPAVLLSAMIGTISGDRYGGNAEMYFVIGCFTTAAAGFMGIIIAVDSFKCLYSRSVVDMRFSLPLTTNQRFFSNFMSGLSVYMGPFFAAQVIALLMDGFAMLFLEGHEFYYTVSSYYNISSSFICDIFSEIVPMHLKLIVCGTLTMLMLYTLSVLITVCCGNKFECIAYSILVNIIVPVTVLAVIFSLFNDVYGVDAEQYAYDIIMSICPAGGIMAAVMWAENNIYGFITIGKWLIIFTLLTIALGALAFFLYRKRRAEQVTKPFVFKLAYYIILTGATFSIYSVLRFSFMGMLITTAIIYLIFEVVANRGFRRIIFSAIRYAVTIAAAFALTSIAEATNGFGTQWRVPSKLSVAAVEIDYSGAYKDFKVYDGYSFVTLRDSDNIEAVINMHKNVLDDYREYLDSYVPDAYGPGHGGYQLDVEGDHASVSGITIKYHLITGGTMVRNYNTISTGAFHQLAGIDLSDEYKEQTAKLYTDKILSENATIKNKLESYGSDYYYGDYYYGDGGDVSDVLYLNGYGEKQSVSCRYLYEHGFYDAFAKAYAKDIMAINSDNYYHSELVNEYTYRSYHGNSVYIPESFTNTLSLLSEYDFTIARKEDLNDYEILKAVSSDYGYNQIALFTQQEWTKMTTGTPSDTPAMFNGHIRLNNIDSSASECNNSVYLSNTYYKGLADIIRNMQPRNIVSENGYVIYVSDNAGNVPEEYRDYAEEISQHRKTLEYVQIAR